MLFLASVAHIQTSKHSHPTLIIHTYTQIHAHLRTKYTSILSFPRSTRVELDIDTPEDW